MTTTATEIARLTTITASERAAECNAENKVRAEAEGWTFYGLMVEDGDFWARTDIHTGLDLERSNVISDISDTYKEKHGIRPRWIKFDEMSLPELEDRLAHI